MLIIIYGHGMTRADAVPGTCANDNDPGSAVPGTCEKDNDPGDAHSQINLRDNLYISTNAHFLCKHYQNLCI